MSWQNSLEAAIRALRKEEELLQKDLVLVRRKIEELDALAKQPGPRKRSARGKIAQPNRLSPQGRAAISRAAKKRWARYRAEKKRQSPPPDTR